MKDSYVDDVWFGICSPVIDIILLNGLIYFSISAMVITIKKCDAILNFFSFEFWISQYLFNNPVTLSFD